MEERQHLKEMIGYEEIPVKDFTYEESKCEVYKITANPSGNSGIRTATHFRDIKEKFDRIFFQKTYAFVCSVNVKELVIRVVNTKKVEKEKFAQEKLSSVKLIFDSPIVRDLIFLGYKDDKPGPGILLVPLAVGVIFQFPLSNKGVVINEASKMPNCKIFHTMGEKRDKDTPMPIKRITSVKIQEAAEDQMDFLEIAVIHPSPGIYIYGIDKDERNFYSQRPAYPIPEKIVCIEKKGKNQGFFQGLKSSFMNIDESDDKILEIMYIGNGMIVVINSEYRAEIRNLKSGEILTSTQLETPHHEYTYQIGVILNDPTKKNTADLLNIVIVFAEIPIHAFEVLDCVPKRSILMLWRVSLENVFGSLDADLNLIFDPDQFSKPSVVKEQSTEQRVIRHSTILGFNSHIKDNLFVSVYNQISMSSEILCYNLKDKGYKRSCVYSRDNMLIKSLIEDFIIANTDLLKDTKEYLLQSLFKAGRFFTQHFQRLFQHHEGLKKEFTGIENKYFFDKENRYAKHLFLEHVHTLYRENEGKRNDALEPLFNIIQALTSLQTSKSLVTTIENDPRFGNMTFMFRSDGLLTVLGRVEGEQLMSNVLSKEFTQDFIKDHYKDYLKLRSVQYSSLKQLQEIKNLNTRIAFIKSESLKFSKTQMESSFKSFEECFADKSNYEFYLFLKSLRDQTRVSCVDHGTYKISPTEVLKAMIYQDQDTEKIENWGKYLTESFQSILFKNSQNAFVHITSYQENEEKIQSYFERIENKSNLTSQGLENKTKLEGRKHSKLLNFPDWAIKTVSHLAARYAEVGAEFLIYSRLNNHLLSQFQQKPTQETKEMIENNIQSSLALSSVLTSILKNQKNVRQFMITNTLKPILNSTGEASVSTDLALHLFNGFAKIYNFGTRPNFSCLNETYFWIDTLAKKMVNALNFYIPDSKATFMKPLSSYLLTGENELDNFKNVMTFVHYNSPFYLYCKAFYNIYKGNREISKKQIFKVASYTQLSMQTNKMDAEMYFLRGPWFYLHPSPELKNSNPSYNLNEFFDLLYSNFSGDHKNVISELALGVSSLLHVNFKIKKKYLESMIEKEVEEDNCALVYNIITTFNNPLYRQKLHKIFIRVLSKRNKLAEIEKLFVCQKENSLITKVLWDNIAVAAQDLKSNILKKGIYAINSPSIQNLRNYYSILSRFYFKRKNFNAAGGIHWDLFKLLAEIYTKSQLQLSDAKSTKIELLRTKLEALNNALVHLEIVGERNQLGYCEHKSWRNGAVVFNYQQYLDCFNRFEIYSSKKYQKNPVFFNKQHIEKLIVTVQAALNIESCELEGNNNFSDDLPCLLYLSLNDVEKAVNYCKYHPDNFKPVLRILTYNYCGNNQDLRRDSNDFRQPQQYYDRIWENILICITSLDNECHGNKLEVLSALLNLHNQAEHAFLSMPDELSELLVDNCPFHFAKKLIEFEFYTPAIDIIIDGVRIAKKKANKTMASGKVEGTAYFDPLLMKKTIQMLRKKMSENSLYEEFDNFYAKIKEELVRPNQRKKTNPLLYA